HPTLAGATLRRLASVAEQVGEVLTAADDRERLPIDRGHRAARRPVAKEQVVEAIVAMDERPIGGAPRHPALRPRREALEHVAVLARESIRIPFEEGGCRELDVAGEHLAGAAGEPVEPSGPR